MSDKPIVRPYRGRVNTWPTALLVALYVANKTGVRMHIRHEPNEHSPDSPWVVTEVDAPQAVTS